VALDDFVRGWGSLIGTLMIVGGVQLIFIGWSASALRAHFRRIKRGRCFFKQTPDDGDR
jgi:hypothetical protein